MQKKYNITIPPDSGAIFKDYDQTVLRPNFPIPVQIDEVVIKYFEIFTGLVILNYSNRNIFNKLYYWHKETKSSSVKLDYVIQVNEKIISVLKTKSPVNTLFTGLSNWWAQ